MRAAFLFLLRKLPKLKVLLLLLLFALSFRTGREEAAVSAESAEKASGQAAGLWPPAWLSSAPRAARSPKEEPGARWPTGSGFNGDKALSAQKRLNDLSDAALDRRLQAQIRHSSEEVLSSTVVARSLAEGVRTSGAHASSQPFSPATGLYTRQHSRFLVAMSLGLSLTTFLAILVLCVVSMAAFAGVPVPMLAALPSSSTALFILQLLARVGQEENAPTALADLSRSLVWVGPGTSHPDTALLTATAMLMAVWFCRRVALRRTHHSRYVGIAAEPPHGSAPSSSWAPHGLSPGAWELRAAQFFAFPLTAAAVERFISGKTEMPFLGSVLAFLMVFFIGHHVVLGLKFVTEVLGDGRVVRIALPATAGGVEVFVDRVCDQLRALPVSPPRSGCPILFGDRMASPAWCIAPAVAVTHEVEHRGARIVSEDALELDGVGWSSGSSWCTELQKEVSRGNEEQFLEDELQGKPLLETLTLTGSGAEECEGDTPNANHGCRSISGPAPQRARMTTVSRAHPVHVTTLAAYEVKAREFIAGVACIPWLDCAVPAGALRRIEELGRDVTLQVHPGQLSGALTAGRFAACFDWGTRWPWRWPTEIAFQMALGVWSSIPVSGASMPGLFSAAMHLLMICIASTFAYLVIAKRPYEDRNDNVSLGAASVATVLVLVLRAFGDNASSFTFMVSVVAASLALLSCGVVLLCAVGLAEATLTRLEHQGFDVDLLPSAADHPNALLPRTIAGWGQATRPGLPGRQAQSSGPGASHTSTGSADRGGATLPEHEAILDKNTVEVILPGLRKAFAIVLPALTRPSVIHMQLLPPVAGRGADLESQPPVSLTGERARLPVPPDLLFSSKMGKDRESTGAMTRAERSTSTSAVPQAAPLVALMAPGRQGRLIYAEAIHNENGADWREAVRSFFGMEGSELAEEAEGLVEAHAFRASSETGHDGHAASGQVLIVIEVLPAFAAEFMDERHEPPNR